MLNITDFIVWFPAFRVSEAWGRVQRDPFNGAAPPALDAEHRCAQVGQLEIRTKMWT